MTPAVKRPASTGLRQSRREGKEQLSMLLLVLLTLSSTLAEPPSEPWTSRNLLQAEHYDGSYDGDALEEERVYPSDLVEEVMKSDDPNVAGEDLSLPESINTLKEKKDTLGFLGARGRTLDDGERYAETSMAQKRKTYGFLGVRGKKAPLGFVGMRGKKIPSGFFGVRGKKDVPQNLEELLKALSHRYDEQQEPASKRGSPMGFIGLRGRRAEAFGDQLGRGAELRGLEEMRGAQKRVPPRYGFIGLRG
ncbi:hypothetical protein FHG87_019464 [Trinorchestia longiramus]|nr:hypothetical protein FHG87_019464 [Trinorchestia longiramus]